MRVRELPRLPRDTITGLIRFEVTVVLLFIACVKRDALAGEGEPIALLGLAAMAAAWELDAGLLTYLL